MKNLQILILEDTIEDALMITNLLSKEYALTLVNTLQKAKDAFAEGGFDLAILDIQVEGKLNGIEFAKHIQDATNPIPFMFLTSMQSQSVFEQARLTLPFSYLVKPFNDIELRYTLEVAIEKFYQQENTLRLNRSLVSNDYILIKKQHLICKVDFQAIEYVEVEDNYSTINLAETKYVAKKSLAKIKEILRDEVFQQIHRKFLVNFNKIKEINLAENTIYLNSGTQLAISERYKNKLTSRFNILK